MKLREVMTTEFCCASPSDSLSKIAAEMKRHNVGAMPVCENGRLMGIITDRDIVVECVASGTDPNTCQVGRFMTTSLVQGHPDMDVGEAAKLMGREQVHRLPVVENGKLVGIVSIGDIAVNCRDDKIVADMVREISLPVRSTRPQAVAA
ncbi:MAG: CBS domain-containing protein [Sphingomonadaceae bacterium]